MSVVEKTYTATIAAGQSLSGAVQIGAEVLCAIKMPAAWTAADLSFQFSVDGGTTWDDAYDLTGNELKVTAPVAGRLRAVDPWDFMAGVRIKVRSGLTGAPVAQGAERAITLICRKVWPLR